MGRTVSTQTYSTLFQVQSAKGRVIFRLPLIVGFFVYQYAKLRMLQFYYDFVLKFVDRADFELCQMDTDSLYMGITAESFDDLVRPELKAQYELEKANWLVTGPDSKRTPGLVKFEFEGKGIIALCSKTYYCWGDDGDKKSHKGLQKSSNNAHLTRELYEQVLEAGGTFKGSGINKGFRMQDGMLMRYDQVRDGLSYMYVKRKVLEDGISTAPLDI
jgi:hypothetical protein